jgi:uncharacterized Zn-finger protein
MSDTASARSVDTPVELQASDLPLHCPGPRSPLWSMHPRVFLDVTKSGSVRCPYCSTTYTLAPGVVVHGH